MKIHDHLKFKVWRRSGGEVQTTNRMTFETDLAPQRSCLPASACPHAREEDPSGHFSSSWPPCHPVQGCNSTRIKVEHHLRELKALF